MSIYNPELRLKFKELNTLNFINEKENIILIRSPGSGKTHYSIGLGYVSFDQEGCKILFNLLSNRNDKGSIIITTNLAFDRWEEIFKYPMLTGAIVDRFSVDKYYKLFVPI